MADALIAARMGSSRFPGKSLAPILGEPMLSRMVERIRRASGIGRVVLATTIEAADDRLADWAGAAGVLCFRGSPDDVLGRLVGAVEAFGIKTVVEMLGDNPLVHSKLIEAALAKYASDRFDYVATLTNEYPLAPANLRRFPIGVRVQVFSGETVRRVAKLTSEQRHREHATSFIAENPGLFRTGFVEAAGPFIGLNHPSYTFAVNFPKNLELMDRVFETCYPADPNFTIEAAIAAFEANPQWRSLMGEPKA